MEGLHLEVLLLVFSKAEAEILLGFHKEALIFARSKSETFGPDGLDRLKRLSLKIS